MCPQLFPTEPRTLAPILSGCRLSPSASCAWNRKGGRMGTNLVSLLLGILTDFLDLCFPFFFAPSLKTSLCVSLSTIRNSSCKRLSTKSEILSCDEWYLHKHYWHGS